MERNGKKLCRSFSALFTAPQTRFHQGPHLRHRQELGKALAGRPHQTRTGRRFSTIPCRLLHCPVFLIFSVSIETIQTWGRFWVHSLSFGAHPPLQNASGSLLFSKMMKQHENTNSEDSNKTKQKIFIAQSRPALENKLLNSKQLGR